MPSFLDFEKPIAELEGRLRNCAICRTAAPSISPTKSRACRRYPPLAPATPPEHRHVIATAARRSSVLQAPVLPGRLLQAARCVPSPHRRSSAHHLGPLYIREPSRTRSRVKGTFGAGRIIDVGNPHPAASRMDAQVGSKPYGIGAPQTTGRLAGLPDTPTLGIPHCAAMGERAPSIVRPSSSEVEYGRCRSAYAVSAPLRPVDRHRRLNSPK